MILRTGFEFLHAVINIKQFVIERDKLYTKNSNLPHGHGELELTKFELFLKNPPISKVFREIGYADELGSGMRNTNKYKKLYSGGVPKFVEENTFGIIIPIESVPELQVGGNVNSETNRVPEYAEDKKLKIWRGNKQFEIYLKKIV